MEILEHAPQILSYGVSGLSLLLALLGYLLLRDQGKKDAADRGMLITIGLFMLICLSLSGLSTYIELSKIAASSEGPAWGSRLGDEARVAFENGGAGDKLNGTWNATWWVGDERYMVTDSETEVKTPYPVETLDVTTLGSQVSVETSFSSQEGIIYWYEGRISTSNNVTLLYWMPREKNSEHLSGVVFLRLKEEVNKPLEMDGWWIGLTRDGVFSRGTTHWQKVRYQ